MGGAIDGGQIYEGDKRIEGLSRPARRTLSALLARLPRLPDGRAGAPGSAGRPGVLYDVAVSQDGTDAAVQVRRGHFGFAD